MDMTTLVPAIMAALAALAAYAVWAQRRTIRAEWTDATSFILIVGWATIAGYAVGTLTGEAHAYDDLDGLETLAYGRALLLQQLALPIACTAGAFFTLRAMSPRLRLAPAGLSALAVWAFGALANPNSGQPILTWGLVTTGAVLAAATVMKPGRGAVLGAGLLGVTVAVASGLAGLLNWSVAARACRFDKCGPMGVLFRGVTGNENALAMLLAMSLPFVVLAFTGRTRLLLAAYLAGMVWVTGSRSSWAAVAVVLAVAVMCRPREVGGVWVGRARPVAVAVLVGSLLGSAALPWVIEDPGALSQRGQVWLTARGMVANHPWFGHGATGWQQLVLTGETTTAAGYSTHNIWMEALFSAGVVGLVLTAATLVAILRAGAFWVTVLPVVALLVLGTLERPWTMTSANWMVWLLPALILTAKPPAGASSESGRVESVRGVT